MGKYEVGDKVVAEIKETHPGYAFINVKGKVGHGIDNKEILGKLEDFQPAQEKIKMTVEEKKEFDEMRHDFLDHPRSVYEIMLEVFEMGIYQLLQAKCSGSFDEQFKLLKCIANPRLIEIVEPKKYTVKIGDQLLFHKQNNSFGFVYHCGDSKLTLEDVKEAEKQLGIQGLQAKWHEAAKEASK